MKTNWRIWAIAGVVAVGGLTLGTSPAKAQGFSFGFSTGPVLRRLFSPRGTGTPRRRGSGPGLSSAAALRRRPPTVLRTLPPVWWLRLPRRLRRRLPWRISRRLRWRIPRRLRWRIPLLIGLGDAAERRRPSLESNGGPVRLARDRPADRPSGVSLPIGSGEDRFDDLARHVGQAEVAAVVAVGQLLVVEAEQVQDRGVQVVDADAVDDRLVADLVGLAVVDAALDAAAGQPDGEGVRVVVAAGAALLRRSAAGRTRRPR